MAIICKICTFEGSIVDLKNTALISLVELLVFDNLVVPV